MKKKSTLLVVILALFILTSIGLIEVQKYRLDGRVPVLIYHCIGENPQMGEGDPLYVSTEKFEWQMRYLKWLGFTPIWAKDINQPLPEKPIVITFDDGYQNNFSNAFPILQKYNFKATIFTVGHASDEHLANYLSWEEMRTMLASGLIDMQSHTYNLHDINADQSYAEMPISGETPESYQHRIQKDINQQKIAFKRELGYSPTVIAYPNGYFTKELDDIYRNSGYQVTFTTEPVFVRSNQGAFALPRVPVFDKTHLLLLLNRPNGT